MNTSRIFFGMNLLVERFVEIQKFFIRILAVFIARFLQIRACKFREEKSAADQISRRFGSGLGRDKEKFFGITF